MESMSEEKCALVAELVQVLDLVRQLEAHMAAGQQHGGDQRCRALVSTMSASIDRAVHMAMSFCAEAGRSASAAGQPESPPSGGDGSPRSAGSDQAGDLRGRGNAAGQPCKKRKTLPKVSTQVRVSAVQDVSPLDDGLSWRKYGQKDILGAKYPRAYFRCTHRHTQSCHASKQVQRKDGDPLLFDVVYHGTHTCAQGAAANNQGAPPPAAAAPSAEHPQPLQRAVEPVLPFSLPSNGPVGAADAGGATSSRFASGCVATASPFVSPATPECLQVSSSYAAGSGGMSMGGVRNVPEVELVSTTANSSPMGEMDFMFPLDTADFLDNPSCYF